MVPDRFGGKKSSVGIPNVFYKAINLRNQEFKVKSVCIIIRANPNLKMNMCQTTCYIKATVPIVKKKPRENMSTLQANV